MAPPLPRIASQYVVPDRTRAEATATELQPPALGDWREPEVRRVRGCPWRFEYKPASKMVARVRLPMYIWIEAAVPLRRARNVNAATVPAGLWLAPWARQPSRRAG